jgi:hypothetical protein
MQPSDVGESHRETGIHRGSNYNEFDVENRGLLSLYHGAEMESLRSYNMNFQEMPQYISPIFTVIYMQSMSLSSSSRQIQMNPISSDEASDDEGPPDLIGDSDDEDSDSFLSCNMTFASIKPSDGSVDDFFDDDDEYIAEFDPTMS